MAKDRDAKIKAARQLIQNEPTLKKEEINARLIDKFGKGLRYSVILAEKRDVFKASPKIIPEKNLTSKYISNIFGSSLEGKFTKLRNKKLWTKDESLSLSRLPLSNMQYITKMEAARDNLITQLKIDKRVNHWSKQEYAEKLAEAINTLYKENGWTNKQGQNEIFRMIDDYRESMIKEGIDPSPGTKKTIFRNADGSIRRIAYTGGNKAAQGKRYRQLHPETVKEQRAKYREKVRAKGGRIVHGRTIYPKN